jgi:hypothetical protein
MTRASLSVVAAVVALLSAAAFFAVGSQQDDTARHPSRGFGGSPPISGHFPGRPLGELPFERAAGLSDLLPLSDHLAPR